MLLLSVVSPKSMTIDRITAYDFMTIYGKDFDVSEKNLHGDNSLTARFNMKDFDIEINGHKKADIHGQGYCSFLNSIVAMVFRSYMNAHATYDPGFVVIDTPLLGLDQGVNDSAPESMRTALFKYFISHQHDGQIIILENIRHIPKLDYKAAGAHVITFTKGLESGRYGFLNDVK